MSRYNEWDDYEGTAEEILAQGRWQRNARAVLKGKRGRKALADLREALLALPEKRLIDSAVCTVGGVDRRLPSMTDEEVAAREAEIAAVAAREGRRQDSDWPRRSAEWSREEREEDRERLAAIIAREGEGVCAIGAYVWHQKVKAGVGPAEAFAAVPAVFDGESGAGDALSETATLGRDAGLAYTLAWELAYRNDETYRGKTPEERYTAFLAWIEGELGETAGSVSEATRG